MIFFRKELEFDFWCRSFKR